MESIPKESSSLFWIRAMIVIGLVYFGYQTVVSVQRLAAKATRERLADSLFGAVMGGLNGYLIAGTLLFYLDQTHYTALENIITAPTPNTPLADSVLAMMQYMPPRWLGEPTVYFVMIAILIFIIVVYI
jgi:ABC-type multidrug transport system permease subunit